MCQERPNNWDQYIPAVLFAYREVLQALLQFSPFELLYGRKVRGPFMILKEMWSNETLQEDMKTAYTYTYVLELRTKLEEPCKLAHNCREEAKEKYKHYYDRKSSKRTLREGDKALVLLPTDKNKMVMQWKGLFVVSVKNDVDYKLDLEGRKKVFHVNMLKKYEERKEEDDIIAAPIIASEQEDGEGIPTLCVNKKEGLRGVLTNKKLDVMKTTEITTL